MEVKLQNELDLLKEYLHKFNIETAIYDTKTLDVKEEYNKSIFSFFFKRESFEKYLNHLISSYDKNTLYLLTSNIFYEYYVFFMQSEQETTLVAIGPFTTKTISENDIKEKMEYYKIPSDRYNDLAAYYNSVKLVANPEVLHTIVTIFYCHALKGAEYNFKEIDMDNIKDNYKKPEIKEESNPVFNMSLIAQRYELENALLEAISKGDLHNAEILFTRFISSAKPQNRASNPIRNKKNYTIILNTLFRKAAEKGKVHPIHIDELSSSIAYQIERCETIEELNSLRLKMLRKYCMLVREHTIEQQHSALIKQAVTLINYDYTADLNLKTIANKLNVNASYLSTLFKQETKETLTEYVTRKRIEYATLLLSNSDLPISDVAAFCGVNDLQYFSKIFKKVVGYTPSEYKKLVRLTPIV